MTFRELCDLKGISPSYTRMRVYEYLDEFKNHATVDQIYQSLKEELPTLSKTTVYNILNLFIENNITKGLNIDSNEARFEIVHEEHSHFKCDVCSTIYDIPTIDTLNDYKNIPNFKVTEKEVVLKGICPSCIKKIEKEI